jgi:hypothetical protein
MTTLGRGLLASLEKHTRRPANVWLHWLSRGPRPENGMFENPSLQGTVVLWLPGSCLTCTFPIQHPLGCESKTLVVQATAHEAFSRPRSTAYWNSTHTRSSCLAPGCGTVDLDQHCTPHHSINKLRRTREQHYYSTVVVEGRRSWCTGMYSRQKTLSKQQHPSKRYVPPAPAEGPIWIWPWDYCGQDRALGRAATIRTYSILCFPQIRGDTPQARGCIGEYRQ